MEGSSPRRLCRSGICSPDHSVSREKCWVACRHCHESGDSSPCQSNCRTHWSIFSMMKPSARESLPRYVQDLSGQRPYLVIVQTQTALHLIPSRKVLKEVWNATCDIARYGRSQAIQYGFCIVFDVVNDISSFQGLCGLPVRSFGGWRNERAALSDNVRLENLWVSEYRR